MGSGQASNSVSGKGEKSEKLICVSEYSILSRIVNLCSKSV